MSTTVGSSVPSLSSAGNSSAHSGNFFRPQPLMPPRQGITPAQYENYVRSYEIYLESLDKFRASFWSNRSRGSQEAPSLTPAEAYGRGVFDAQKKFQATQQAAVGFRVVGADGKVLLTNLSHSQAVASQLKNKGSTITLVPSSPEDEPEPQPEKATSRVASPARRAARRRQKERRKARDLAADTQKLTLEREHAEAKLAYAKVAKLALKLDSVPASKTTPETVRSPAKVATPRTPVPNVPVSGTGLKDHRGVAN